MQFYVKPCSWISGEVTVAGDKSISHRSIILGALAEGTTEVFGLLEGTDVLATIAAFRHMGVAIERAGPGVESNHYAITGVGMTGLRAPGCALDLGNSGTAFRLLTGLLCAQGFATTLTGDESLKRRPMSRIVEPLRKMGARIAANQGQPPLTINPVGRLVGTHYSMPIASAQVKSAVLLAGLYAQGETVVVEPAPTRDHTERMLRGFGYDLQVARGRVSLTGGGWLLAQSYSVPADLSSAAFFIVAALLAGAGTVKLCRVGVNPSRSGIIPILLAMGAKIALRNRRESGGEPVADIEVVASELYATDIRGDDIALAIDEIPIIAVAAAYADGTTTIRDAGELRVKESDRIAAMVQGLRALGVRVDEHEDGMTIHGGSVQGGYVDSHADHRIAMAFAIAGIRAESPVVVDDCENVATSFPDFVPLARQVGLSIEARGQHDQKQYPDTVNMT